MGWSLALNTNLTNSGRWYGTNCVDINKDGSLDIIAVSWGNGVKCYINNLSGNFDLTAPGAVSDLTAINATTTNITVEWTAPADNGSVAATGPVQSYDLRYSTSTINDGNWDSTTHSVGVPIPLVPGVFPPGRPLDPT